MSSICDDLRAAILQAAMQGKLTEQLPEDGNAEELLVEIKAKKEELITDGKIKKQKEVVAAINEPFDIPDTWKWVNLGELVYIYSGLAYSKKNLDEKITEEITVLRGGNIGNMSYALKEDDVKIDKKFIPKSELFLRKNQLITPAVTSQSNLGKIARIDMDYNNVVAGGFVLNIVPFIIDDDVFSKLFCYFFSSPFYKERCNEIANKSGQAFYNLNRTKLQESAFPLPPLAEQKRIVKKVDKLMARVADLEQSADALASLKKAFPDDIKASLLQAAMQGKLTEQLPEDGCTEDLLEEIKAEKEKLIAEGKIKRQKALSPIADDEIPFSIPKNWRWARIGDITFNHGQKTPEKRFSYIDVGTLNNIDHKLSDKEQIIEPEKASSRARKIVHRGDVIYATIRPYLHNICLIDRDFSEEPIASTAFAIMSPHKGIYNKYLFEALLSPDFDSYANRSDLSKGVAYPAIGEKDFFNGIIPIPPLAEQKRIVERLDSLMQNINMVGELIASE